MWWQTWSWTLYVMVVVVSWSVYDCFCQSVSDSAYVPQHHYMWYFHPILHSTMLCSEHFLLYWDIDAVMDDKKGPVLSASNGVDFELSGCENDGCKKDVWHLISLKKIHVLFGYFLYSRDSLRLQNVARARLLRSRWLGSNDIIKYLKDQLNPITWMLS